MKYKKGDKVRVRSKEWYDNNKSYYGDIECGSRMFYREMSYWCGRGVTIKDVYDGFYRIREDGIIFRWTDEMFEGLVEEETKLNIIEEAKTYWDSIKDAWICPDGYEFRDENGNVIETKKIVLEKKKPKYPTSYAECCRIIGALQTRHYFYTKKDAEDDYPNEVKILRQIDFLRKLLICRDAYWKLAGDWKPVWDIHHTKYIIICKDNEINGAIYDGTSNYILAFPTAEMRDAFYENFKELINECKELL